MTINWKQMSAALLIALALHGGVATWLTLPTPEPAPVQPLEQPLRVSLLAIVAETTTAAEPVKPPPKVKPPVKPKPKPKPKPTPTPKEVIQKPTAEPEPTPEPPPKPEPVETPLEMIETPVPVQEPAPVAPTPPPLNAAATAKYEQLLVAWLERQKKYPRRAKRMRIEGEGRLRITIDRTGQTQSITLEQSTGNRLLDKATLEMARRANPFPPMMENDPRQTLEFIVPVVFALR